MSEHASVWALAQTISRASVKLVLVALGVRADAEGLAPASPAKLHWDTGLDPKTIIANVQELARRGLIRDSGRRDGRNGRTVVYQVGPENGCSENLPPKTDATDDRSSQNRDDQNPFKEGSKGKEESEERKNHTHSAGAAIQNFGKTNFSELDFVSDDGLVVVPAGQIAELERDLPALGDRVRGHMRQAFRLFADKRPDDRVRAVRFYLLKKDTEAAVRADDLAMKRAAADAKAEKTKKNGKGVYGDDFM